MVRTFKSNPNALFYHNSLAQSKYSYVLLTLLETLRFSRLNERNVNLVAICAVI